MQYFRTFSSVVVACATLVAAPAARATDIIATTFDAYGIGTLSGQVGFSGTGGTWATSGSTNSPYVAASVIGPGTAPGVDPVGGTGKMVRLTTEKFLNGRSKAWLDLSNSGQWAAASTGGKTVLETRVKIFVPSGQRVTSTFGIMISQTPSATSGGFLVSAQTGAISFLNGGYAVANRVASGVSAPLNQWNEFIYRWNVANGTATLSLNGQQVASHVTSTFGAVYASNLFATTDSSPGTNNAFGYFDDVAIGAVAPTSPCPTDLNSDGQVDAADLASLLGAWGTAAGDVNGDGQTDAADLAALLGSWGPCS
ncbi:MAG: hypothetical protein ACKO3W_14870 [bacterium]